MKKRKIVGFMIIAILGMMLTIGVAIKLKVSNEIGLSLAIVFLLVDVAFFYGIVHSQKQEMKEHGE